MKKIADNKTFWKTAKPFISYKCHFSENITIVNGDDTVSDNDKVANIVNDFFYKVVKNLKITINENIIFDTNGIDDPVLKTIEKYNKYNCDGPPVVEVFNIQYDSMPAHPFEKH